MRKKILLPTDFSKNAWNAISFALEIYKDQKCDFYLLNVFTSKHKLRSNILQASKDNALFQEAKSASEEGLKKVRTMINFRGQNNPNHAFYSSAIYGEVLSSIKEAVEEEDIDIVVMGTKGASNTKGTLFGTHATDAMEKVRNCPVLVVPEEADAIPPKEIVFANSYRTHLKRRELGTLIEIADNTEAAIRILHVSQEPELDEVQQHHKAQLESMFENLSYSFHTLHHIEVLTALNCFVESRNSAMVAFINKKHAFFGSLVSRPLVKEIGKYVKVPILVMHDLRN